MNLTAHILQKSRNFAVVWLIYFAATVAIALVGTFVVLPILKFARWGVLEFLPSIELALRLLAAVLACSSVIAVVMWAWGEISTRRSKS